jgi:hypothetical protein
MRYWSPILGCEAARLSMANDRGSEYFTIIEAGGRGWREAREKALGRIEAAIEAEKEPGEVT